MVYAVYACFYNSLLPHGSIIFLLFIYLLILSVLHCCGLSPLLVMQPNVLVLLVSTGSDPSQSYDHLIFPEVSRNFLHSHDLPKNGDFFPLFYYIFTNPLLFSNKEKMMGQHYDDDLTSDRNELMFFDHTILSFLSLCHVWLL